MRVKEVIQIFEDFAHPGLQEDYDNSGLNIGDPNTDVTGILCCVDVTEAVLEEAIELKANLIVSHHPVIFTGLKSITGKSYTERIVIKAIQNQIALFVVHTNADNAIQGVNHWFCAQLELVNTRILQPKKNEFLKLVTFVPTDHAQMVREALFDSGAGHIGNYDSCSFNSEGTGTFRGNENTNPFAGEKGNLHSEKEVRIETILPAYLKNKVINQLLKVHPYEEVAYDLYPLANDNPYSGAGMMGYFEKAISPDAFLRLLQTKFSVQVVRYTSPNIKEIKKVAVCGGSGSFLIRDALRNNCDALVTGDIKYHQFFDAEDKLLLCDIGHYESEQFTKEIFYHLLTKKLSNFAVHLSKIITNPIKYYT